MAKLPRKKKPLKLPKKPKASASISTWENWEKRCKAVKKQNADNESAHKKAVAKIASDKKRKEAIINRNK